MPTQACHCCNTTLISCPYTTTAFRRLRWTAFSARIPKTPCTPRSLFSDCRWTDWWASRRGRLSWTLTSASSKPSRSGIPRATPSRSRGLFCVRATIPEVPSTSPTGYFGSRTRASVEAIQRAYGLPVTGYVNAITWRYITDLYSDLYVGNRLNQGQYPGFTVG